MIERLKDKEISIQLQKLPEDYVNRVLEYQKLPLEMREGHTCISFINFIATGKGFPFFDPNLWPETNFKKGKLKIGNVLVFLPKKGSYKINHCAMSIGDNNLISKIPGSDEIIISDLLDIVENYEDTRSIGVLEYQPKLT